MQKSEEMKRLEADMASDKELYEKFNKTVDRIAGEKTAQSDGELFAKAASELGFNITAADFERLDAENEEVSADELEQVAGGFDHDTEWCLKDYYCDYAWNRKQDDKELTKCNIDIRLIFTNAALLNAKTLDMLEKYHQQPAFQLSFDGLGHHDWLRGVEGAEKQADTAFRLLQERGYSVAAAMCIHKGNKDSLRDTIKYLADYGVRSLRLNAPQELGVWKQYSAEYALSEDEVWAVYRDNIGWYFEDGMPIDLELDGYFSCRKGSAKYRIPYVHHPPENADWSKIPQCESMRHHIYIGPEGRLAPCMGFSDTEMGKTFPNVLDEHLGTLTMSDNLYYNVVNTRVSDFRNANPECVECEHFREYGGGCMAEGMAKCGSYLAKDERACYFHKHIGEKAVREAADAAIERFGRNTAVKEKEPDDDKAMLGAKC